MNEQYWRPYDYEYTDQKGTGYSGTALYETDDHAVSYFRSLEENGGIKMRSLRNPQGHSIWDKTISYRRSKRPF